MPELTRRRDPNRANSWLIYYADVHVGTIARSIGNPDAVPPWKWSCGIYPGPGDQRGSTAATFAEARAAFKAAWQDYLPAAPRPTCRPVVTNRHGRRRNTCASASGCRRTGGRHMAKTTIDPTTRLSSLLGGEY